MTKISLFVSLARDEQDENCDIDLIIELEKGTENIYELKQELRELLQMIFNKPVEIAREKYQKAYAKDTILEKAIIIP